MKVTRITSLVGFLLTLSALNPPVTNAKANQSKDNTAKLTIEGRIAEIAKVLRERENQLQESSGAMPSSQSNLEDGADLDSFRKFLRAGVRWINGYPWRNGGFINWRDGWRDGGGFLNFRNW